MGFGFGFGLGTVAGVGVRLERQRSSRVKPSSAAQRKAGRGSPEGNLTSELLCRNATVQSAWLGLGVLG